MDLKLREGNWNVWINWEWEWIHIANILDTSCNIYSVFDSEFKISTINKFLKETHNSIYTFLLILW